jgi:hypothetical protein
VCGRDDELMIRKVDEFRGVATPGETRPLAETGRSLKAECTPTASTKCQIRDLHTKSR